LAAVETLLPRRATEIPPSLSEVNRSIAVGRGGFFRKLFAFSGPGYLVAVGYMDPGNWATDIAGGSAFDYSLLSVILLSNLMAIVLQALSARLGIASGYDLAQACRRYYPRAVSLPLWVLCEIAIVACDLAEVIGTAIALNLLFGLPLLAGVILTALDVMAILALQRLGFRYIEAFVIALLLIIGGCFAVQIAMAQPELAGVLGGFVPDWGIVSDPGKLYIAIGILGATVMPHNLYLHSSIVQTRRIGDTTAAKREAIRYATIDSTQALMLALTINAAILIVAAATFHTAGHTEIAEIGEAHAMLTPLLGVSLAATLFAVALLASGLNSTVTATLAGQIVMEGFLSIRLPPWLRRLTTRLLAIIPAVFVIAVYGEEQTGRLLILSQVILSLQLPFAVIPLVHFTSRRDAMGPFASPRWLVILASAIAVLLVMLNTKLIVDFFT
jgi:manganese transport protein